MVRLNEIEKQEIRNLYDSGLNCVQIKNKMNLKGHQQVLNVLKNYKNYVPYKYGRGFKRIYTLKENYFEEIDTEEKAYILGFIAADGSIDLKNNRLKFLIATKDIDILKKIKICLESNTTIKNIVLESRFDYGKRYFYHSKVEFCSKKLVKDLINLGFKDNKTYSLDSSILQNIPKILIRHFLRGYFDGDGNVFIKNYKDSNGIRYSINVVGNLEFLQNSFGSYFPTKNKYYLNKKSKQCYSYKLSSKENVLNFLKYLYKDSNIFLNRKYKIYAENNSSCKTG